MTKKYSIEFFLLFLLLALFSCESEKRFPPNGYIPNTPELTEKLEAAYFWVSQDELNSPYWKDADYVEVSLSDGDTKNLYGEGFLNMTGTYNGVRDFNKGKDPEMTLKAGYDDEYLYILAEWKDTTADPSFMTRILHGFSDADKPEVDPEGWTSQRNQDNILVLFDNDNGKDVWKWSMASSAPLNMAHDLEIGSDGELIDDTETLIPNSADGGPISGPRYEWSGNRQEIILADGTSRLLDPAYYIVEEESLKIDFVGNVELGRTAFNDRGNCKLCHGPDGNGVIEGDAPANGGPLNRVFTNRYSREGLVEFINSSGHEGRGPQYWGRIKSDSAAVVDILAFMRGIAGQPGHTLIVPADEPEIRAYTNVAVGTIQSRNSEYKVLFRRKLTSSNPENVQFSPTNTYKLSIRLSDNDEINYIESETVEMIFNINKL